MNCNTASIHILEKYLIKTPIYYLKKFSKNYIYLLKFDSNYVQGLSNLSELVSLFQSYLYRIKCKSELKYFFQSQN